MLELRQLCWYFVHWTMFLLDVLFFILSYSVYHANWDPSNQFNTATFLCLLLQPTLFSSTFFLTILMLQYLGGCCYTWETRSNKYVNKQNNNGKSSTEISTVISWCTITGKVSKDKATLYLLGVKPPINFFKVFY